MKEQFRNSLSYIKLLMILIIEEIFLSKPLTLNSIKEV